MCECVHTIQCLFIERLVKEQIKISCVRHAGESQLAGDDEKGKILVNKLMLFSCCSLFSLLKASDIITRRKEDNQEET